MTGLNDRFNGVLEKTMGNLVGQMTGRMEEQIQELRKTTQKQLDEAEARVAGMQAALLMAQAVISRALGTAPKNGEKKDGRGGVRKYQRLTAEQKQQMIKEYRETTEPLDSIGKRYGVSGSGVYLIAKRLGVAYSRKGWPTNASGELRERMKANLPGVKPTGRGTGRPTVVTPEMRKRIWERHLAGLPGRQIAQSLGIGHATVERALAAHRAEDERRKQQGRAGGLKAAANKRRRQEAKSEPATAEATPTATG